MSEAHVKLALRLPEPSQKIVAANGLRAIAIACFR
jgi:hypothetical protein